MRKALPLALAFGLAATLPALAQIDTTKRPVKDVSFSFDGPFGTYDRGALQRGFQVYKEVCSTCHALNHIAFRNLADEGGPGFSEAQAKAIAAGYKIPADPNDKGDIFDDKGVRMTRAGTPADYFPPPFPNENAARANNSGALPPDLSLVVKAREGGRAPLLLAGRVLVGERAAGNNRPGCRHGSCPHPCRRRYRRHRWDGEIL